jgi:hypothetical protein
MADYQIKREKLTTLYDRLNTARLKVWELCTRHPDVAQVEVTFGDESDKAVDVVEENVGLAQEILNLIDGDD